MTMRVYSQDKRVREAVDAAVLSGCHLIVEWNSKAKLKSPSGRFVMLVPNTPKQNGHAIANWLHKVKKLSEK